MFTYECNELKHLHLFSNLEADEWDDEVSESKQ